MQIIETLTTRDVESPAWSSTTTPVVIDFYQASCPPCRVLEPRLERVASQYHGVVRVFRVDIERDLALAQRFGIRSLPTVLAFRDGREVQRLDGLITERELSATFARIAAQAADRTQGGAASPGGGS